MISEASQILETIRALGADIVVDLKVRPASRVPDDLIHRAAAHADEIRALLAESAPSERPCWRCNADPEPPSMDEQLETLFYEHKKRPEIFHLRESEIARLKSLLQPGDMLAIVTGAVVRGHDPMYAGIAILRDGKIVIIDRRELADG